LDLRKIKKLIELVEESGISELEVRDGEEAIRIARPVGTVAMTVPQAPEAVGVAAVSAATVTAPMAGTFYAASAPDADPFVRLGMQVEVGQVVGIIESMKMMNEIVAESAGICAAIEVANGQAVASGQILLRLE
jgi:acetyl-CoA carboxylase biotin carboxyl carrier protein